MAPAAVTSRRRGPSICECFIGQGEKKLILVYSRKFLFFVVDENFYLVFLVSFFLCVISKIVKK